MSPLNEKGKENLDRIIVSICDNDREIVDRRDRELVGRCIKKAMDMMLEKPKKIVTVNGSANLGADIYREPNNMCGRR